MENISHDLFIFSSFPYEKILFKQHAQLKLLPRIRLQLLNDIYGQIYIIPWDKWKESVG